MTAKTYSSVIAVFMAVLLAADGARAGPIGTGAFVNPVVDDCCVSIEMTPRCLNRSVTPW